MASRAESWTRQRRASTSTSRSTHGRGCCSLPPLRDRCRPPGGAIVAMTSEATTGNLTHGASKGRLEPIVISAARELGLLGAAANVLNPVPIDTRCMDDEIRESDSLHTPQLRLGTPATSPQSSRSSSRRTGGGCLVSCSSPTAGSRHASDTTGEREPQPSRNAARATRPTTTMTTRSTADGQPAPDGGAELAADHRRRCRSAAPPASRRRRRGRRCSPATPLTRPARTFLTAFSRWSVSSTPIRGSPSAARPARRRSSRRTRRCEHPRPHPPGAVVRESAGVDVRAAPPSARSAAARTTSTHAEQDQHRHDRGEGARRAAPAAARRRRSRRCSDATPSRSTRARCPTSSRR